ncbi:hypothetical protein BDK51DRAFT_39683 [Blyttiomyces helicus]|uniref:Uncharacterized protein n=1 Tax=Blyttiomyces helicus TaxID=388810 RepID=A0A4P9WAK1_9FUNG|nr:hypothetical protein BDK51DRAFT_39683 [Blyttiomyces helicus]|eukprot:RKO89621.1 hypothetical protein BDK51DRAFT_39683 [Blyttiomyces helicus]
MHDAKEEVARIAYDAVTAKAQMPGTVSALSYAEVINHPAPDPKKLVEKYRKEMGMSMNEAPDDVMPAAVEGLPPSRAPEKKKVAGSPFGSSRPEPKPGLHAPPLLQPRQVSQYPRIGHRRGHRSAAHAAVLALNEKVANPIDLDGLKAAQIPVAVESQHGGGGSGKRKRPSTDYKDGEDEDDEDAGEPTSYAFLLGRLCKKRGLQFTKKATRDREGWSCFALVGGRLFYSACAFPTKRASKEDVFGLPHNQLKDI